MVAPPPHPEGCGGSRQGQAVAGVRVVLSLGVFRFRPGADRTGLPYLREFVAWSRGQGGCVEVRVARSTDDPDEYLVYGRWQDEATLNAAMARLRAEATAAKGFFSLLQLLTAAPVFHRYEEREV
mgnify:CR=1 FL=1